MRYSCRVELHRASRRTLRDASILELMTISVIASRDMQVSCTLHRVSHRVGGGRKPGKGSSSVPHHRVHQPCQQQAGMGGTLILFSED